jgi:hypothetical protein
MAGWSVVPNPDQAAASAWKPVAELPTSGRPAGLPADVDFPQPAARPPVAVNAPQTLLGAIKSNFNANTQGAAPGDNPVLGFVKNVGQGGGQAIRGLVHPIDTLVSTGKMLAHPLDSAHAEVDALRHDPSRFIGNAVGQIGTGSILGGELLPRVASAAGDAGTALRTAAIGDTDAAAVRGLKIPANSPKMQSMLKSVQTARPYLQGAESLEDLQRLIPQAKAEIWSPYQQTIEAVGDHPVKGPDGMTTIGELEKERLQLSALNRGLKSRLPEAIQEAQQKGMSAADLLDRERAVTGALDPALSRYGIDPQAIRGNFGAVARIGKQVSGKDTIIEPQQPYGFGKMAKVDITKPLQDIGNISSGVRDLVAGRPLLRGSPTDIGIREGFRGSFEKPNLGQYTPFRPTGLLEAPPIELGAPPEEGGVPAGYRPPPFYHDTTAMRTGRLLPEGEAPPIQLHGSVEATPEPIFRYDTTPMRQGRLLPVPMHGIPLSSYSDIFPDQLPGGSTLIPKIIEGKK